MSKNLWLGERTSVAGSLNSRISLCLKCQHPKWVLVYVPAVPLLTSLPMNGLGMWQRTAQGLVPLHSCGKPRRSSWLWIGPAPVIAVIWGTNQWLEDSVSCSHSVSVILPFKLKWNECFLKKEGYLWKTVNYTQLYCLGVCLWEERMLTTKENITIFIVLNPQEYFKVISHTVTQYICTCRKLTKIFFKILYSNGIYLILLAKDKACTLSITF